jgi:hypothetical protein
MDSKSDFGSKCQSLPKRNHFYPLPRSESQYPEDTGEAGEGDAQDLGGVYTGSACE